MEDFIPIDIKEMRPPGFFKKVVQDNAICVDNVSRGKGWRSVTSCPLCGSGVRQIVFGRLDVNIVRCGGCGCGYTDKFPIDTADVYSDNSYIGLARSGYLDNVEYRKKRFAAERLGLIEKYAATEPGSSRLLDVGCGTGWFLEAARERGYDIAGQELGKGLAKFTSEKLNIKVWDVPLSEKPDVSGFDVITLFDVIEHIPDPKNMVRNIRKLLKPGGIAMIYTPNFDSLAFRYMKEKSNLVMPAEHLFYFTPSSLRAILEENNLEVIYFATKGMDIPDIYAYLRDEAKDIEASEFLYRNCDMLQAVIDKAGCANHMRFIVRRGREQRI
ncbi:MAG: class I SAM-dependent methyltransferase [Candidatus Omnitrophica bacterium]|nr:class I SAM-dependent methyltransferase [Candidatus Omnitrophota bacterium]